MNIATALKSEITRIARNETHSETQAVSKHEKRESIKELNLPEFTKMEALH